MNHCSHWTRFYGHPAYRDFNLARGGTPVRLPRGERGNDLRRRLLLHRLLRLPRRRCVHRQAGALARRTSGGPSSRSRRSLPARRRDVPGASRGIRAALEARLPARIASACRRPGERPIRSRSCSTSRDSRIEPVHQLMTLRQLAFDFFEAPRCACSSCAPRRPRRAASPTTSRGCRDWSTCCPSCSPSSRRRSPWAGARRSRDALMSAGRKMGVEYLQPQPRSISIVVEGDRAAGVELADGSGIDAELVVSDLGAAADGPAPAARPRTSTRICARRIGNIHYDRGQLLWVNVAMHEPPQYTAETGNPGVGRAAAALSGPQATPTTYATATSRRSSSRASPDGRTCSLGADSIWDPTRAPAGKPHRRGRGFFCAAASVLGLRLARCQGPLHGQLAQRLAALRAQHDAATM